MVGWGSARSTSPLPAPRTACLRGLSPRGPSVASSADLPGSPDPVSSPRILLRGECSTAASAGLSEALWPLLLNDHTRVSQLGATPSAPAVTELQPVHRIKSIVVAPSPGESVTISGKDPGWIEVSHHGGRRTSAEPPVPFKLPGAHRPDRRQAFNAGTEQIRTVDIHDSMSDPHPEDVGSEEELSPDSLGAAGSPSICSRLFVMKLCSVMSKFNLFKRELAKEIGFEGMLDLKPWQKINLKYIAYLMDRIDPDLSVINLESQGSKVLSEQSVHGIFGLPCGPKQITAEGVDPSKSCIEYTRLAAMFSEKGTHSLKAAEFILLKEITQESSKIEKDCFKIALVVFVDGHVLAPSAKHDYITIDFWAAINNMEEASQWNWFGYVVKHLFVAVFVLDNMMLGELSKPTGQNPRIALYDYESVKKMVEKVSVNLGGGDFSYHGALVSEKLGILLRKHNARGLANAAELRQAFQASMFNFADKVVACIADTCTCCKSAGLKQCVLKTQATDVPATQDLVDLNYQTPVRRRTTGPADNIFGCGGTYMYQLNLSCTLHVLMKILSHPCRKLCCP
ncbi:hypothetical protein ZWY2020_016301 [Hordeum vulgare]|nr:hypothetical protein ZWY2020_016301 [Hordeum vulgare]